MYIGHDGQVMEKEGKSSKILDLLHGVFFYIVRPDLHRTIVNDLNFHFLLSFDGYTLYYLVVRKLSFQPESVSLRLDLMPYCSRRIAGAKLQMRCAVFLRNAKRLAEIYEKRPVFSYSANRMRRNCVSLWR